MASVAQLVNRHYGENSNFPTLKKLHVSIMSVLISETQVSLKLEMTVVEVGADVTGGGGRGRPYVLR